MIVRNDSGGPLDRPDSGDVSWPTRDTSNNPALDSDYRLLAGAVVDLMADGYNVLTELESDPELAALIAAGDLVRVVDGQDVAPGVPTTRTKAYVDYNHDGPAISVTADTWTDLPNNGLGTYTKLGGLVNVGATALLDTSTGYLDFSDLRLDDELELRQDIEISTAVNGAEVRLRLYLGEPGVGEYELPYTLATIGQGSGAFSRRVGNLLMYLGDANTKGFPGRIQVYCTEDCQVRNNGVYIKVQPA